jgi:LPXTG-motif cell wall-anchored protein
LKELLTDWHNWIPLAGLAALALVGIIFWLRRKPVDPGEIERQRRAFLNRVGRIVEGQVLEIADHARDLDADKPAGTLVKSKSPSSGVAGNGTQKLLYYTYSISGVTYETAQDVTGLEERLHLTRVAAGQTASVKYDPSNPSNSILLADDWSGLH